MPQRSATTASDAALIARVRLGDAGAFELMGARHRSALHDLASILTAAPETLVEGTLEVARAAIRRARGPRTWVRGYLLDLALQPHATPAQPRTTGPSPPQPPGRHEAVGVCYARLPDAWQAVLWHRFVEQDTSTEVGAVIGVSRDQVDALVGSARTELLRSLLLRRWGQDLPAPCRAHTGRLIAAPPGSLPRSVLRHTARCPTCDALVDDLRAARDSLPNVLAGHVLEGTGERYLAVRHSAARDRLSVF